MSDPIKTIKRQSKGDERYHPRDCVLANLPWTDEDKNIILLKTIQCELDIPLFAKTDKIVPDRFLTKADIKNYNYADEEMNYICINMKKDLTEIEKGTPFEQLYIQGFDAIIDSSTSTSKQMWGKSSIPD